MDEPFVPDATVYMVGKVVFESQRFEEGLKYLLLFDDVRNGRSLTEEEQLARIEDRTRARAHLTNARNQGLITEAIEALCNEALGYRDKVVHRLMREHGSDFQSPDGRAKVTAFVSEAHDQIKVATYNIAPAVVVAAMRIGFTEEHVSGWIERSKHPLAPS